MASQRQNWRLRRPYHVVRKRGRYCVYKTTEVNANGSTSEPTDYDYSTYEEARGKADVLNLGFKFAKF